jgi:hypothetical protein
MDIQLTDQIKRGNQIIESGEFIVNIGIDDQAITNITKHPRDKVRLPCQDKHRQY